MALSIVFPERYGYVVLCSLGLIPVLSFAQGILVGKLRKPAGIAYPTSMATAQEAKESQACYQFNCAQRAHGNLLENMPQTMISMLFAGLEYPIATAALGAGWVLFRCVYTYGYVYGSAPNGKNRLWGSTFWLMQGGIWGLCMGTALKML